MKCYNPHRLPNPAATGVDNAFIQVGCGKCYACLSNRRRGWLFRLYNEHINSLFSIFCTFTYDGNIFYDGNLHKEHFQKFIKRLRQHEDITYYAIGEFGTHTHRAHYHAVIFFKTADTDASILDYYLLINKTWKYGFTYPARVTYRRLNYVLHYHVRPKEIDGKFTFQLFSKGLGVHFLDADTINYLVSTKAVTIRDYNGNQYVIPRYYRKKLIDMGYDIDAPRRYDEDYSVKRIEKAFNKPIYQIPSNLIVQYMKDLVSKSNQRIAKYNNQDKFI